MAATTWPTPNWPEGVANNVSGYEKPLYSILDDAANEFPNQVYTIFNDATRTFAQVKDTADRIANFLASRGIQKGDRVAIFLSGHLLWNFKSRRRWRYLQSPIYSE
jgi:long-chain acyl-CoA synthetase